MATVEGNKKLWDRSYGWPREGQEWSDLWGGSDSQWYRTIFPRICRFIPTGTILEIAPGFGRWSHYLKNYCDHLILVDLSEKCIQACKNKFSSFQHISCHVNDGKSLAMVEDHSVDFVFCFDSLVHVEEDVIRAYLEQLAKKLKKNGAGFFHHSNLGEYEAYFRFTAKLPAWKTFLWKLGLIDYNRGARALDMTASRFLRCVEKAGLSCISQEKINWKSKRMTDCISVFTQKNSTFDSRNKALENKDFMKEAEYARKLSSVYGK